MTDTNTDQNANQAARLLAVQALYQMDIAASDLEQTIADFREHNFRHEDMNLEEVNAEHFESIVRGVFADQLRIDRMIDGNLSAKWQLARLDSTLRAILRCGTHELLNPQPQNNSLVNSPTQIVKQYVDMAHAFFDGAEGGMANAVLDKIHKEQ